MLFNQLWATLEKDDSLASMANSPLSNFTAYLKELKKVLPFFPCLLTVHDKMLGTTVM
jgi:hypothetical protein